MLVQETYQYGDEAKEVEALYFRLYHSYLLQTSDLKTNYEMMLDAWNRIPQGFQVLSKNDLLRLNQIQDDLKNNRCTLFSGPLELGGGIPDVLKREKTSTRHKDICREISRDPSVLEPYTGPISFLNREHPTKFGPVDLLAYSGSRAYVIEVKTDSANHAICGQVQKYWIGISLKLFLKFYDDVKIITLCPGYDQPSYQGLRRIGSQILLLKDNPLEINELNEY